MRALLSTIHSMLLKYVSKHPQMSLYHHHVPSFLALQIQLISASRQLLSCFLLSLPAAYLMYGFQTTVLNLQSRESYSQTESDWPGTQVHGLSLSPPIDSLHVSLGRFSSRGIVKKSTDNVGFCTRPCVCLCECSTQVIIF